MLITEVVKLIDPSELNIGNAAMSSVKLYRGIQNQIPEAPGHKSVQDIRTDRRLLDSSPLMGETFDLFMQALGVPMRKANTASVTTKLHQTIGYGAPCRVFPINGTSYLYSEVVKDFIRISREIRLIAAEAIVGSTPNVSVVDVTSYLDDILSKNKPAFVQYIKDHANELQQTYKMKMTTNVNQLKNAAGEILLYGTPHFLAIRLKDTY